MRRMLFIGLVGGVMLLTATPGLAANTPWLSVSPPVVRPGDTVVFTIAGPPGYNTALAFSSSNLGAGSLNGQPLLLGSDLFVLTGGVVGAGGSFTFSAQVPIGLQGEVFLQGAVWPPGTDPGTAASLTNGVAVPIAQAAGPEIMLADLALRKDYHTCPPTMPSGIQFEAVIVGTKPIREAMLHVVPTNTFYSMLPLVPEPDFWMTRAGYGHAFGFEDEDTVANLGRFPDGDYMFHVTFADGTMATATTSLGGAFPSPATITPGCGATGVSRAPTFEWSATGATAYEVEVGLMPGSGHEGEIWEYRGTATSVTMPPNFLSPNTSYSGSVRAWISAPGSPRKGTLVGLGGFTTGP